MDSLLKTRAVVAVVEVPILFPRSLLSESDVIIPSNILEAYKKKRCCQSGDTDGSEIGTQRDPIDRGSDAFCACHFI